MQVPRLFAVLFAYLTFWRPKKVVDQLEDKIRLATFWCLFVILLEDKKSCMTFCRPFFSFGRQKVTKRTAKSRSAFFGLQFRQETKKTAKSHWGHFGWQKVVMVKRTAKSRGTCVHLKYCFALLVVVKRSLTCLHKYYKRQQNRILLVTALGI